MTDPEPYIRRKRDDVIDSDDWNDIQIKARRELYAHSHTGGDNGALITGAAIDPGSKVTLQQLDVTGPAITGSLAVSGALTAASGRITQESWQAPALLGNWVRFDLAYNAPGFYKDSCGVVHLRGVVKSGTVGKPIFQLPPGYRPETYELFAVNTMKAGAARTATTLPTVYGRVDVTSDGTVIPQVGSPDMFSLDGLSFRAFP